MTKVEILFRTGRVMAVYATALGRGDPSVKRPFSSGCWRDASRRGLTTPKETGKVLNEQFDFFVEIGYISSSEASFYESVFEELYAPFFFLPEFIYPGAEREIAEDGWKFQLKVLKERLEEFDQDASAH